MKIIHSTLSAAANIAVMADPTLGKKVLGSGATAKVYTYNSKLVVRHQTAKTDYLVEDHYAWVKFCLENPGKHVPAFSFVGLTREPKNEGGEFLAITTVLERLDSVGDLDDDASAMRIEDYLNGECMWGVISKSLHARVKAGMPYSGARALRSQLTKSSFRFNDLHDGNWMRRASDGAFVITDPIC